MYKINEAEYGDKRLYNILNSVNRKQKQKKSKYKINTYTIQTYIKGKHIYNTTAFFTFFHFFLKQILHMN